MIKVFAVILNYNGFADTKKCLQSLHKLKGKNYRLRVVVVDNGSRDYQKKLLLNYLKKTEWGSKIALDGIQFIENSKNLGFAAGNNLGIRFSLKKGADYVLILNNDTVMEMNILDKLFDINAHISSPAVKFRESKKSHRFIYDLGGYVNWWTGRTEHNNVSGNDYQIYAEKKEIAVDYVSGCSMLIKKQVFKKIGLFDENYFFYFEDVDFCIRAGNQGLSVIVCPGAVIYHKLAGSIKRWSNKAICANLTGNFVFITKHLGLRRITGYVYLFALTCKIIFDRLISKMKI